MRESAVTYPADAPDKPGRDVVFDKGFPRPGGFGKLVAAELQPPDEACPDDEFPSSSPPGANSNIGIRRDVRRPRRQCSTRSAKRGRFGIARHYCQARHRAGRHIRISTRRGTVELDRAGRRHSHGVVFIPFAFVEAAATCSPIRSSTHSADSGIQFCAAKVERVSPQLEAAEYVKRSARRCGLSSRNRQFAASGAGPSENASTISSGVCLNSCGDRLTYRVTQLRQRLVAIKMRKRDRHLVQPAIVPIEADYRLHAVSSHEVIPDGVGVLEAVKQRSTRHRPRG